MKQMFESATIKMTAWYLLILMTISILFSVLIYQISTHEVDNRFSTFQTRIERGYPTISDNLRLGQMQIAASSEVKTSMFVALAYMNILIFALGGIASYFLARHTLKPIEELHEAEARFASNASHELRTPLAVMKSEIEVLLRDKNPTEAHMRETLESNLEEVNRLTSLSQTLLHLSRGDLSPQDFAKTDLIPVLKLAIKNSQHTDQKIRLISPRQLKIQRGNSSSLTELFMILIDNAQRYSTPKSAITIEATNLKSETHIAITNDGPGISTEDLPHVFERFYRGDKSHSGSSGKQGYGLGLALAKQIVELHQGSISIQSTPGELTTTSILLPKI